MDPVATSITHFSDMQQHLRTAYKHAVIHGFTDVAEQMQATMRMMEERYWGALRRSGVMQAGGATAPAAGRGTASLATAARTNGAGR
jgi:hypothetical protein